VGTVLRIDIMENQMLPPAVSSIEQAFTETPTVSRRSRSANNRDSNPRGMERSPINFGTGSQFNLPLEVRADTRYRFGWTPFIVRNEEDMDKCDRAQDAGWLAVESEDYPSLVRSYKHRENSREKLVKRGGTLLQRREEELCQRADENNDEEMRHNAMISAMYERENPLSACFDQRSGHGYVRRVAMNKDIPNYGNPFNFGQNIIRQ
jgi:hypothetical protein